jgi:peptidoglycan hydrolase-like protein with peptidoglycan-binding domain
MTKEQTLYYSAVNEKNKTKMIDLLKRLYPDHYFIALNDDAISYVMQFQKNYGLYVDGLVGQNTLNKMRSVLNIKQSTTPTATIEKPSGQAEIPGYVPPVYSQPEQLTSFEERLKSFVENNKVALFLLLVVGLWAKKR